MIKNKDKPKVEGTTPKTGYLDITQCKLERAIQYKDSIFYILLKKYNNTRNNYTALGTLKTLTCFPLDICVYDILYHKNYFLSKCRKKQLSMNRTAGLHAFWLYPVDTRHRFNVYKTSIRRLIDVVTTSCGYWATFHEIAINFESQLNTYQGLVTLLWPFNSFMTAVPVI